MRLLVDSGGFAALFDGARVIEERGFGVLEVPTIEGVEERLHPMDVLEFQEQHADTPSLPSSDARLSGCGARGAEANS